MKFSFILLLVSGCLRTREDIQEIEAAKAMKDQVVTLQKVHAESATRLDELMEQNRQLNGRIAELEQRQSVAVQSQGVGTEEVQKNLDESKRHSELLQESIVKLETQVQALQEEIVNLRVKEKVKESSAQAAPKPDENAKGKESLKDKEKAMIDLALADFQNKKWKEAILNFDHYREKNPKGKYVSEATYKTGVCFQELGMLEEAKVFYNEVIDKYPKTDSSKKALFRIKTMDKAQSEKTTKKK